MENVGIYKIKYINIGIALGLDIALDTIGPKYASCNGMYMVFDKKHRRRLANKKKNE